MIDEQIHRLFVGGLFHSITEQELGDRFRSFGEVTDVQVVRKGDEELSKTFGYVSLKTNTQKLNKCFAIFGGTKWKGYTLKVQLAKEDFMAKLKKEWAEPEKEKKPKKRKKVEPVKSYSEIEEKTLQMKRAVPGTFIEGEKDWVVGKYGRPLPIVRIKGCKGRKPVKVDPSKHCHCLRKLNVNDGEKELSELTWSLGVENKPKKHKKRSEKNDEKNINIDEEVENKPKRHKKRTEKEENTDNIEEVENRKSKKKKRHSDTELELEVAIKKSKQNDEKSKKNKTIEKETLIESLPKSKKRKSDKIEFVEEIKTDKSKSLKLKEDNSEILSKNDVVEENDNLKAEDDVPIDLIFTSTKFSESIVDQLTKKVTPFIKAQENSEENDHYGNFENPFDFNFDDVFKKPAKEPVFAVHEVEVPEESKESSESSQSESPDGESSQSESENEEMDALIDLKINAIDTAFKGVEKETVNDLNNAKEVKQLKSELKNEKTSKKKENNSKDESKNDIVKPDSSKEKLSEKKVTKVDKENWKGNKEESEKKPKKEKKPTMSKAEKHAQSEKVRLEAMERQNKSANKQKGLVANALKSIESAPSNRITFQDEEEDEVPSKEKKMDLFEDDDSENEDLFKLKPQFQGEEGEKLFKLQKKFAADERFKIDERFADSDDENNDVIENNTIKTDDVMKETNGEDLGKEKDQNISLLEKVLGKSLESNKPNDESNFKFDRYDPSAEEALKYEVSEESEKEEDEEVIMETAPPAPVVSKDTFYLVDDSLKSIFSSQNKESGGGGFSFLSNETPPPDTPAALDEEEVTPSPVENEIKQSSWKEALAEQDIIVEEVEREEKMEEKKEIPTFFFTANQADEKFMRSSTLDEITDQWKNLSSKLHEDYKKKHKDALRRKFKERKHF